MANSGAGWSASRRNSKGALGLLGVPSIQEHAQIENGFDFNFDLEAGQDSDFEAQINAFCADPGKTNSQSMNDLEIKTGLTPVKAIFDSTQLFQAYYPDVQSTHANGSADYPTWPESQSVQYSEPQGYYTSHEIPYFNNSFNRLGPSGYLFGTPGLAAIPGNSNVAEFGISQCPAQPYALRTESWALPAGVASYPVEHTDYPPVDHSSYNDVTMQLASYPQERPLAIAESFITEPAPCLDTYGTIFECKDGIEPSSMALKQHPKWQESPKSDSDLYEDYQESETKPAEAPERGVRKQLRNGSMSSDSTGSPSEPVKYKLGEKPKKVDAKPWIRTNANTEGDTRTAKINNWKNKYQYKPLPLGAWSSGKHTFVYNQYENVDFLTETPMSTRKIKEYIMKYPSDNNKRLILWIQKMPADQGRRYGSKQHSKCVFRDCPIQRYVEGTISTGEYRVAFDEKHYTYGDEVDPYDCVAYAHLYCMEQFLDFERVCQVADVRVDTRLDMPLEPNSKAAFSMVDVPARHEMERFVKAALKGKLRYTQRWKNYPVDADYERDQQKPHERTLTYLAHRMYEAHQDDSHKKQAALRRITVSQRRVHLGDLEMSVADKRIMIEVFGGKKKGRKGGKVEDHYDNRTRHQLNRAKQEAEDFLKRKRQAHNAGKKGRKRKVVECEDTDDGEVAHEPDMTAYGFDQQLPARLPQKIRASRHKKQRLNYAESPVDVQYSPQAPFTPPQLAHHPEQLQQLQTYVSTDRSAPSQEPAPVDPALDSILNTAYGVFAIPTTPSLDISNFPVCEEDIPDENLEKLLALDRRQSCTAELGPMGILKSPGLTRGGRTPRRAEFGAQPVSSSKEYFINDPPNLVTVSKDVPLVVDADVFGRRSARIAAKTSPRQTA